MAMVGEELKEVKLTIKVYDEKGETIEEKVTPNLKIPKGLTRVADYPTNNLPKGPYVL